MIHSEALLTLMLYIYINISSTFPLTRDEVSLLTSDTIVQHSNSMSFDEGRFYFIGNSCKAPAQYMYVVLGYCYLLLRTV